MNIISANSPRCLLVSPAKILRSLSNVERAPPPAAVDFDPASASHFALPPHAPVLILALHFLHCSHCSRLCWLQDEGFPSVPVGVQKHERREHEKVHAVVAPTSRPLPSVRLPL